ncbi:hypothetical protein BCL57_001751 [Agromyces flavus]|uniref:Uncharacterized protein n=1 Tax=Agromyces flavus TaxID=589382 RepID=A0A1H1R9W7_9MICO|nr:hypothetical protein [Agromyces flavus]MCP2367592.1 hypothetical protein [Agromyces flavus]GGI47005.1 hypothetical protein GCM10010932_17390 [Agromyces flavus]SDS32465.1 hypothetical protein SAMN04489721_1125 [Agromyces flavus]
MSDTTARTSDPVSDVRYGDTAVFGSAPEPDRVAEPRPEPAGRNPKPWGRDLRFMLVVIVAIAALFLAFALVVAFTPNAAGVSALAVVAAPIATMVAAYYGISLALRQVGDARRAADAAEARARAAETTARESDAWAAQMESGLRVAVAKLAAARIETRDVERAAGTPDDFF